MSIRKLFVVASLAAVSLEVFANPCKVPGCKRYAPEGKHYCSVHWAEGKAADKKAAAEAKEIRKVLKENAAVREANEKAAQEIREKEEAKEQAAARERAREKKIEKRKFEQPLEGLFGRKLGELIPGDRREMAFTPEIKFREFTGYTLHADAGSQEAVMISAYRDMGRDEKLAREELEAVLALLKTKYDRKLNKIFTRTGNEVYALGFGGKDGVAAQTLQLALKHIPETGYRLVLSAAKVASAEKVLVEQETRDIKAL